MAAGTAQEQVARVSHSMLSNPRRSQPRQSFDTVLCTPRAMKRSSPAHGLQNTCPAPGYVPPTHFSPSLRLFAFAPAFVSKIAGCHYEICCRRQQENHRNVAPLATRGKSRGIKWGGNIRHGTTHASRKNILRGLGLCIGHNDRKWRHLAKRVNFFLFAGLLLFLEGVYVPAGQEASRAGDVIENDVILVNATHYKQRSLTGRLA